MPYIQVATTVEHQEQAEALATTVLEKRLAACVQVQRCSSMYHWQGTIEKNDEFLCTMKTRDNLFEKLQSVLIDIHPYEVPEILATPVVGIHIAYREWLENELQK